MKLRLQASNNLLVACEGGGDNTGIVNARTPADQPGPWEELGEESLPADPGYVALYCEASGTRRYFSAQPGGSLVCNRVTPDNTDPKIPANLKHAVGEWERAEKHTTADGRVGYRYWTGWLCADLGLPKARLVANRPVMGPYETFVPTLLSPPVARPTRLRSDHGRFVNDLGPWTWHGISEFSFVHLVRTGREAEMLRRRDRAVQVGKRNIFRTFLRAVNLFDLNHTQPGYMDAVDRVVTLNAEVGAYTEAVIFCDAQSMSRSQRRAYLDLLLARFAGRPEIVWQISNEPWKNGWSKVDDPELLSFAEVLASAVGHRNFSIGDPLDGDNPDASAETVAAASRLAPHANILPLHSSRLGGVSPWDGNLRRWINHLEGFYDLIEWCRTGKMPDGRQVPGNPNLIGVHDEPMGHASKAQVASHDREYDPQCALAGAATAQFIGAGYTYHYISEQDDGTPGLDLIGQHLAPIPAGSGWRYLNDSWTGAPTHGFTWEGGKVRSWANGPNAYVLAYGLRKGQITWANGFKPEALLFDGDKAQISKAKK